MTKGTSSQPEVLTVAGISDDRMLDTLIETFGQSEREKGKKSYVICFLPFVGLCPIVNAVY